MILALDTTREYGSLALAHGDEILEEVEIHAPAGFGQVLYERLEWLLTRHGVKLAAIDCFAAASGPGSFTGVRVGLACVKGLAEAVKKPAAAISNLQALASFGTAPLRAPIIDARRGDIYGAVYDTEGLLIAPEVVAKLPEWLKTLPAGPVEFIAQDFAPFEEVLTSPRTVAPRVLAGAIARIAHNRMERGEFQDPAALDANYVRRADAELFWKE